MPSFTRNWLSKRRVQDLPPPPGKIDRAALGTLHAGLFAWTFAPDFSPIGWLLRVGAALNFSRLLQWHGHAAVPEQCAPVRSANAALGRWFAPIEANSADDRRRLDVHRRGRSALSVREIRKARELAARPLMDH